MASTVDSDVFSSVAALQSNLGILSPDQIELAKILLENGQSHLFQHWPHELGVDDNEKLDFFEQISRLNSSYPGGLAAYIKTAKELLADSKVGKNPYDGFGQNMIRWQSERSFEQQHMATAANSQNRVMLVQTLVFADKVKTEAAITELLVGLNYIWRFEREMTAKALFNLQSPLANYS